jgi:regulatory protein
MNFFKKKPKVADARQVFDYACWLLARRNYSQAELLKKFHERFIPAEEIFSAALAKLQKLGFQSDELFAESFVRTHSGWGARKISLELRKRGIDANLIEKFLLNEVAELENCREVLAKKLHNGKIPTEYKAKQKLASFLAGRGFDLDIIRKTLE